MNNDNYGTYKQILDSFDKFSDILQTAFGESLKVYTDLPKYDFSAITGSFGETIGLIAQAYEKQFNSGIFTNVMIRSVQEMVKPISLSVQGEVLKSIEVMSESLRAISNNLALEHIKILSNLDYSALFSNIIPDAQSLSQIIDSAYDVVNKQMTELEDKKDSFTEQEIQDAIQEQISNPVGFQERVSKWSAKKIAQYFIIWKLIEFIWANFAQPYFIEYIGMPVTTYVVSNVKELPEKGAEIIGQLKENVEAIIIENANYYYKVSFTDENGEMREGYVAKRNLKIVEEKAENETNDSSDNKTNVDKE